MVFCIAKDITHERVMPYTYIINHNYVFILWIVEEQRILRILCLCYNVHWNKALSIVVIDLIFQGPLAWRKNSTWVVVCFIAQVDNWKGQLPTMHFGWRMHKQSQSKHIKCTLIGVVLETVKLSVMCIGFIDPKSNEWKEPWPFT